MNNKLPWILGAVVLVLGYWLAFNQPTELEKQVADGEVYVFWVRSTETDFETVPLRRDIPKNLAVTEALKVTVALLLTGPNAVETSQGLITMIPAGVGVNSVVIDRGTAVVDFNEKIDEEVAGSATVLGIAEQLEKTIKRFPGVHKIKMTVNGERPVKLEP